MNQSQRHVWKSLAIGLALLPALAGCATPSQMAADAEVRRLCAIDGGIKVYETVKLPSEKFNEWGQIRFYMPTQGENALGPEFTLLSRTFFIRSGNPQLARYHIQVIRRSDSKLIGESISYGRGGGDLPSPAYGSSFHCPAEYGDILLFSSIFKPTSKE